MNATNSYEQINARIAAQINVTPGMKMSVMYRQAESAIQKESLTIAKWNAAFAKTFPDMKKKEIIQFFNATIDGKYVKFPDGSQARY